MTVDIAIPTYCRPQKLSWLIKSILVNDYPGYRIIIIPDYERKHVFRLINEASQKSDADIFLGISDDTEFERDVIISAVSSMKEHFPDTDGIIYMNWLNLPNVCKGAIAFTGKKFRERFPDKFIYCPDYISLYADDELGRYAESINKLAFCSDTGLHHYHPSAYPDQVDITHKLGRVNQPHDLDVRSLRKAKGYLWGKDFNLVTTDLERIL
ncbi:MAG: hypothetical protein WCI77_07930 [Candidatus Omnitrophota bacterium]